MQNNSPHAPRNENAIRTAARPECYVCGREGDVLYADMSDRLFNVQGRWTLKRCVGADCGLVWLDPMPVREDIPKLYETYFTHEEETPPSNARPAPLSERPLLHPTSAAYLANRYGYPAKSKGIWVNLLAAVAAARPWRRASLDHSMFYLDYVSGGRLLEIGCGDGAMLQRMKAHGWEPQGIDFDAKAVKTARATGIEVQLGGVEDQHFPDNHFDAIVMNHVIEHFDNPRSVLRECGRILKPGGQMVVVTPNARSLAHRLYGQSWLPLEPPRHLHIFTLDSLTSIVEEVGLQVIGSRTAWIHAASVFVGSRSIDRCGRYEMGAGLEGRGRRWADRWSKLEAILTLFAPGLGEELVLRIRSS